MIRPLTSSKPRGCHFPVSQFLRSLAEGREKQTPDAPPPPRKPTGRQEAQPRRGGKRDALSRKPGLPRAAGAVGVATETSPTAPTCTRRGPGYLTSDGSQRQRTASQGSAHPGVAGKPDKGL